MIQGSHSSSLLIILLLLACSIITISAEFMPKYRRYSNLAIDPQYVDTFKVSGPLLFNGKFEDPLIECGVACNSLSTCSLFSITNTNSCVLFSDQISLIYSVNSVNSTLYNKGGPLKTCIKDHYPDLVQNKCILRKLNGVTCQNTNPSQCSVIRGLTCYADQSSQGICQCWNTMNYWDSTESNCLPKKSHGSQCSSTSMCLETKGLVCSSNYCTCPTTSYLLQESGMCEPYKLYGQSCTSTSECTPNSYLECGSNSTCQCASPAEYDQTLKVCKIRPFSFSSTIDSLSVNTDSLRHLLKETTEFHDRKFSLLYRASRDGYRGYDFHTRCNGVNDTLTIVKSQRGNIFGGFTSKAWHAEGFIPGQYFFDPQAFLFTLVNPYNTPGKHRINYRNPHAIYDERVYGPTFGAHDLHISDNCNSNTNSHVHDAGSYYSTSLGNKNIVYESTTHFTCVEVEVYATIRTDQTLIDSTILTTDTLKSDLKNLIGFQNKEFSLLHRGSRDGFTDHAYHGRVDGAFEVLAVIKSINGYILGAYLERPHQDWPQWCKDSQAFIFTLINPYNTPQVRFTHTDHWAAHLWSGYGTTAIYGSCWDIHVSENANTNTGSYTCSGSYKIPPGGMNSDPFFVGGRHFQAAEIEHFATKTINKLLIDSTILVNDEMKSNLRKLIGFDNQEMELKYRGTRDGFGQADFNYKVRGAKKYLVVAKSTNGYVFGAYSSKVQPDHTGMWLRDPSAFLFSLINPSGVPFKRMVRRDNVHLAHHQGNHYMVYFGHACDFYITDQCHTHTSNHHGLGSYRSIQETDTESMYTGGKHFQVAELEVFETRTIKPLMFNFIDSLILTEALKIQLREVLGFQNKEFTLLYRATRDGFNHFHDYVDYQPMTLSVIKSSAGFIFGGFLSIEWIPEAGYQHDSSAFTYTLVNPSNSPKKLRNLNGHSVYSTYSYGPTYGAGHDIHIRHNSHIEVGSYIWAGYSYEGPNGLKERAAEDFFTSNYRNWLTVEIEVYTID